MCAYPSHTSYPLTCPQLAQTPLDPRASPHAPLAFLWAASPRNCLSRRRSWSPFSGASCPVLVLAASSGHPHSLRPAFFCHYYLTTPMASLDQVREFGQGGQGGALLHPLPTQAELPESTTPHGAFATACRRGS